MAEEDAGNFGPRVPDNVRSLVDHIGLIPELEDSQAEEMYSKVRHGRCLACSGPLAEDTLILVNQHGVVGAYCGGACMSDFAVLGWLQEQHGDITDAIDFRGGRGDEAPE